MAPGTSQIAMEEWERHREIIESLYSSAQSARSESKNLCRDEKAIVIRDTLASGKLEPPQLSRALFLVRKDTGQSQEEPGKLTVELSRLSDECIVELYDLVTNALSGLPGKEGKEQKGGSLEYVRAEMQSKHGLEAT